MDRDLREAERSGDHVALLWGRVRVGEVAPAHVEFAARLGHVAALTLFPMSDRRALTDARGLLRKDLFPDVDEAAELAGWLPPGVRFAIDWGDRDGPEEAIDEAATLLGDHTLSARVAADWAERVLPVFEGQYPKDARPRDAIAAARAWIACPCEDHRQLAKASADGPASDAYLDAYEAAVAAEAAGASDAVGAACAVYVTESARDAAAAAANAGKGLAAYKAGFAAHAAAQMRGRQTGGRSWRRTREGQLAHDAEHEWQRLRLAAYVLREVTLGR